MGDKVNPWRHWPNPQWKFNTESSAGNLHPPDAGLVNANSLALPAYQCTVAAPVQFFTASVAERPLSMAPRYATTLAPSLEMPAPCPSRKRPFGFYQKENHGLPLLSKGPLDPVPELQGSNETNVTDVGAEETQGIHENTDEINALLDSDSDEGYEKLLELHRVRRQSPPAENDTLSVESVASAGAATAGSARPAKKRRLSSCTDRSVVDTASSARPDHSIEQKLLVNDCDAQSCCVGEVESNHKFSLGLGDVEAAEGDGPDDLKRRRERIQETVAALRNIVPGGIAKGATAVLDEAICYLQYLKLKVKTLGAASL